MTDHTPEMEIHEGITSCPFIPFSQWADNDPPAWAKDAARICGEGSAEQKADAAKVLADYAKNAAWTVYTGTGETDASLWIHATQPARLAWPIIEGGKPIYRNEPRTPLLERMRGAEMLDVDHPLYRYESVKGELAALQDNVAAMVPNVAREWLEPASDLFGGLVKIALDKGTTVEEFERVLIEAQATIPDLELNDAALEDALVEAGLKAAQMGARDQRYLMDCALQLKDDFLAALHGSADDRTLIKRLDGKVKREIRDEGPDTSLGRLASLVEQLATDEKRPPTKKELREAYNKACQKADSGHIAHNRSWLGANLRRLRLPWLPKQVQS